MNSCYDNSLKNRKTDLELIIRSIKSLENELYKFPEILKILDEAYLIAKAKLKEYEENEARRRRREEEEYRKKCMQIQHHKRVCAANARRRRLLLH